MNHTLLNNQERARQLRIRIENITILLLAVFSFFLFLLTFFPFSRISKAMQGSFEMGRMVQRAFSIVLFVLSLQLWKRKRNAWTIAVGIFVLNFLRGLIGMGHPLHNGIMIRPFLIYPVFHHAERFLLPGRTRKPPTNTASGTFCHHRCPHKCRDHLALYAARNRGRCFCLLCRQLHSGNQYDLRHGKSSRVYG